MQDITEFVATSSILCGRSALARRPNLKCPRCKRNATIDCELRVDAEMRCMGCGELGEFRQFREADARAGADLIPACPEIYFPHDRLTRDRP
ncbi:MAG: hypothetical protein ABI843_02935 [Dokdonella sp.]